MGNNLKDRSAGTVILSNYIVGGNRQLDLVESGHEQILNASSYRTTFVGGNILIEPENAGNSQIIHYGGDNGNESNYRKGILYFYYNTIYSSRNGNTTLIRLSSSDEEADVRNNIIYTTAPGNSLAILNDLGSVDLYHNWLKEGWVKSHSNANAAVSNIVGNLSGIDPGFVNTQIESIDLSLTSASVAISHAIDLSNSIEEYLPKLMYDFTSDLFILRPELKDIGAIEFNQITAVDASGTKDSNTSFKIYNNSLIKFDDDNTSFYVTAMNGKVLLNGEKMKTISIKDFAPGFYILTISRNNSLYKSRFFKY